MCLRCSPWPQALACPDTSVGLPQVEQARQDAPSLHILPSAIRRRSCKLPLGWKLFVFLSHARGHTHTRAHGLVSQQTLFFLEDIPASLVCELVCPVIFFPPWRRQTLSRKHFSTKKTESVTLGTEQDAFEMKRCVFSFKFSH